MRSASESDAGPRDQAVDREPPVGEAARLMALEGVARRRGFVGERRVRDLAAAETRAPANGGEQPLRRIRQGLAGAVDAAVIGRDQSVTIGDAVGGGEARRARRRPQGRVVISLRRERVLMGLLACRRGR